MQLDLTQADTWQSEVMFPMNAHLKRPDLLGGSIKGDNLAVQHSRCNTSPQQLW